MGNNSEIFLYQTSDGQTKEDVRLKEETVWLSQAQMVELFMIGKDEKFFQFKKREIRQIRTNPFF